MFENMMTARHTHTVSNNLDVWFLCQHIWAMKWTTRYSLPQRRLPYMSQVNNTLLLFLPSQAGSAVRIKRIYYSEYRTISLFYLFALNCCLQPNWLPFDADVLFFSPHKNKKRKVQGSCVSEIRMKRWSQLYSIDIRTRNGWYAHIGLVRALQLVLEWFRVLSFLLAAIESVSPFISIIFGRMNPEDGFNILNMSVEQSANWNIEQFNRDQYSSFEPITESRDDIERMEKASKCYSFFFWIRFMTMTPWPMTISFRRLPSTRLHIPLSSNGESRFRQMY